MSRRASLPGAEELFRRTGAREPRPEASPEPVEEHRPQVAKSTKLQVADPSLPEETARKAPKHDEKITFYCTSEDLMALERTRLDLKATHGVGVDRGRIVRAAVNYVLEDFEARGEDSILLRELTE